MKALIYILCLAITFSPYSYLQAQVNNSDTPYNEIVIHLEDFEEQALVLRKVIEGRNINVPERVNDIEQLIETLQSYLASQENITAEELISFFESEGYQLSIINDTNPNYLDPYEGNGGRKVTVGIITLPGGVLGVIITFVAGWPVWVAILSAVVATIGFASLGYAGIDQDRYARLWGDEQDRILELIEYWKERTGQEELDPISIFNIDPQ